MADGKKAQAKARFKELTAKLGSVTTQAEWNAVSKELTKLGKKWGWDYNKHVSGGFTPPASTPSSQSSVAEAGADVTEAVDIASPITDRLLPVGTLNRLEVGTDPRVQEVIDFLEEQARAGVQYTDLERQALAELEAGLGGYTAPEVQAMREAANQEIQRNYQTALAGLARANARGGVRGAASAAGAQDLAIGAGQTKGNLERDLLIRNADVVQQRRLDFGNLVNATEAARTQRGTAWGGLWTGASQGEEAARRGRETYNAAAGDTESLTRASTTLGTAGTILGREGSTEQVDILKDWNDFVKGYMNDQLQLEKERAAALRASLNT